MNLIDKCENWEIARTQRKTEIERGLSLRGTMGFEDMGCYECKGFNPDCKSYFSLKQLNKGRIKNESKNYKRT